ncbi:MAG: sulfite exporter TauE/SafE family protein [Firmicutes bacterium]|nr:sulfite exporter TauE/SafE family protein [Bacillota bacterium]
MNILYYILAGLFGGVLGGMGMGGGTVLIPILTIFLGIGQTAAQGINLITFIPMAVAAIFLHAKNKLIDFKILPWFIIPGVMSAVGGAFIAKNIDAEILQKLFGGFLIALAVFQICMTIFSKKQNIEG